MKRCMGCMNLYGSEFEICPDCGYIDGSDREIKYSLFPGTFLGNRYQVGKVIGTGGTGITYIGWDDEEERRVAIKEYFPYEYAIRDEDDIRIKLFSDECRENYDRGLARFRAEAEKLYKFRDIDGIVNIYDVFDVFNTTYIVKEYIEGQLLEDLIKEKGRIFENETLSLILPVMQAVSIVNDHGIIHRDITPDNLLISKNGSMKLIDFGAANNKYNKNDAHRTVIIKTGYSPIEQYRKQGIQGEFTDVYALGATIYRMLTGEELTDSLDRKADIERLRKDPVKSYSELECDISEHVYLAVLHAVNVEPEKRTRNVKTFIKELTSKRYNTLYRKKVIKKILIISSISALICLVTATIVSGYFYAKYYSRVPELEHLNLALAIDRVEEENLEYEVAERITIKGKSDNEIIKQSIVSGSVEKKYTRIKLIVNEIEHNNTLVDVMGMSEDNAKRELQAENCKVTVEYIDSKIFAEGTVVKQEKISSNEVLLKISKAKNKLDKNDLCKIKDYVDTSFKEVIKKAVKDKVVIEVKDKTYSDVFEEGRIIRQSPVAGKSVSAGDVVKLYVSLGSKKVIVPNVLYMEETLAKKKLNKNKIVYKVTYEQDKDAPEGIVIRQEPTEYTQIDHKSEVQIYVNRYPK